MNDFRKLPKYFSLAAILVSAIMVTVKGITPHIALCRMTAAALSFYFLGLYISIILGKAFKEEPKTATGIDVIVDNQEEFEELKPPVVEAANQDVLGRG